MSISEPARARGRRTRARILECAADLFAAQGHSAVSVAAIARAAQAYPHQITYYFGSKDGLFVHAALSTLLREARRLESVGLRRRTPGAFRTALARTALALPAVPAAIQAMSIARVRPELQPVAQTYLAVLFRQAEHYLVTLLDRRDWAVDRPASVEVRTFWSAVLGARLIFESGYGGRSTDVDLAGLLTVRTRQDRRDRSGG
ncbi:TetR/AcrR family transcriptional regulator C-terminal domain-containing protein [Dactylosporangium sp. NPDC048998]|uniref:TetR/AcrR family transcriptional regulator C-terminal domain-containing protein n=1 Tax=Dactylosporangium sp. NPDC048998 TaxID=3363976 RepID=UPI00370FA424